MASVMASRFSVLKIEDDSDQEREKAARKKAAEEEKNKKKLTKKKKKSKSAEPALDAELMSMAFGMPKPKKQPKQQQKAASSSGRSESPRKPSESEQSEWEKRDQALIDDAFERDLQQAMLMSRVAYEERETQAAAAAADPATVPETGKHRNKKAKPTVLSVDQLQTLSSEQIDKGDFSHLAPAVTVAVPARPLGGAAGGDGADFFDQVERRTKEAVTREKAIESIRRDRPPGKPPAEPCCDLQLQLAAKESELDQLRAEMERTREELKLAKSRTKRVLSVLTQSETKEKVQLIVSLEKAQAACEAADRERADMSAQVTSLLAQLEQERSRVHQLTVQLRKVQGNKRRGQSENDTPDSID